MPPRQKRLRPQSIEAIARAVTGGSFTSKDPIDPIGIYRSEPDLQRFVRTWQLPAFEMRGSRLPAMIAYLDGLNGSPEKWPHLVRTIEGVSDPGDFLDNPQKHVAVLDYLNARLSFDGLEIQGGLDRPSRLVAKGGGATFADNLAQAAQTLNLDTVRRELDRAAAYCDSDPELAVTAACSMIESGCRTVLDRIGATPPAKLTVTSLWKATATELGVNAERSDLPDHVAEAARKEFGGLAGTVDGVGRLRDNLSSAHGRAAGQRGADSRLARLAVGAAGTATLFLIETWQKQRQTRP